MKVLVNFKTAALGDTIGGMPAVAAYKQKENCDVYVCCKWSHILKNSYPTLIFVNDKNDNYDKIIDVDYHFEYPLQEGFARDLGFQNWVYQKPLIDFVPKQRPIINKYVAIGMQSTAQCKYWNYPNGWDELCKMFRKIDVTPVCIDQNESFGVEGNWNYVPKKSVKRLNNTIEVTMNYIYHSEFFVGISSGLSWVAHAMGKKVVMISGITEPNNEFEEDCIRIINRSVCHGCFHKVDKYRFDPGDWFWCGEHKGTERQFECTKTITPESVFQQIKNTGWI